MPIRVLLIDDDAVDRELAARALRRLAAPFGPVELVAVGSWADGAPHLAAGGFDLLLLDFNLPGVDGMGVLKQLAATPHPPVIMLTGQDDVATAVETLRSGAHEYVRKTAVDVGPALRLAVTRVLEHVALERELAASRARLETYAAELEEKVKARTSFIRAQAAEIEALYLRAEEAMRVKAQIIANLSHELRTPLNALIGYAELLDDEIPDAAGAAARDTLSHVRGQIGRLRNVVESLLTLVQLRTGQTGTLVSRFTCGELLEELRADAMPWNADKGLEIQFHSPEPTAVVEHDREKIAEIAYHLLQNAIKFTATGRVSVTVTAMQGGVSLTVADTGVGVPADARQLIFEDFRQLDGSNTRRFDGLGLGLGIVKRFAALLGGRIELESVPDVGTTVHVDIPPLTVRENAISSSRRRAVPARRSASCADVGTRRRRGD